MVLRDHSRFFVEPKLPRLLAFSMDGMVGVDLAEGFEILPLAHNPFLAPDSSCNGGKGIVEMLAKVKFVWTDKLLRDDLNVKFLQTSSLYWRNKNMIRVLRYSTRSWISDDNKLNELIINYFENFFTSEGIYSNIPLEGFPSTCTSLSEDRFDLLDSVATEK
ncbi:hypothetical protein ACH5RR_008668 [Cinchona calisaya]|uniref:Uncharacterized protein n=1 Tax=Cinchona calisaya TaxID=153742 RepID=A0ABD3AEI0_9GENT